MLRAINDFDSRVEKENRIKDVLICNTIHDSVYGICKNDAETIKWVNDNLINAMEWQEHPKLQSDIKLGAELDIGNSWDSLITIKNNVSLEVIQETLDVINKPKQKEEN